MNHRRRCYLKMVLTLNKQKTELFDKFLDEIIVNSLITSCAVHPPSRLFIESAENYWERQGFQKTSTSEHVIVEIAVPPVW